MAIKLTPIPTSALQNSNLASREKQEAATSSFRKRESINAPAWLCSNTLQQIRGLRLKDIVPDGNIAVVGSVLLKHFPSLLNAAAISKGLSSGKNPRSLCSVSLVHKSLQTASHGIWFGNSEKDRSFSSWITQWAVMLPLCTKPFLDTKAASKWSGIPCALICFLIVLIISLR